MPDERPAQEGPATFRDVFGQAEFRALLTANSSVTFSDGGSGFGNYVFYGGLQFPSTHTTVTFYPGRYVLAGTQSGNDIISYHTQVTIQDNGTAGVQNTVTA